MASGFHTGESPVELALVGQMNMATNSQLPVAPNLTVTEPRDVNWLVAFYRSTVGKKVVMGITGLIGVLFVFGHMAGNLQVFEGAGVFNRYSQLLRTSMELLWAIRIILLLAVVFHVIAAYQLARTSQRSRPVGYAKWKAVNSTFASRTMRWTGPVLLVFIVYHLLHFTTGTLHGDFIEGDVYHNVLSAFQIWWVSAIYIAAMLGLSLHLYHGIWSLSQSLGLSHPRYTDGVRTLARILTVIIVAGFIAIPVAVLFGLVQ
jgi:succinate dehydrogenase / fumarate reductase cytochrome b subunit